MKKTLHTKCYNRGENDKNSRCSCKACENYLISSLSLSMEIFEEEIYLSGDCVNNTRG